MIDSPLGFLLVDVATLGGLALLTVILVRHGPTQR